MSEIEVPDCPLCMEAFEIDDINFFPCTCGYQVCRFCWHRIRTDENGLCPACRKTYSEDPAMYQPLSQDELQKIKKQRKQREVQQRQKASDNRQHLSNIRVIQKHLVFVVGLSNKMADPEVLRRQEYFGKYGKILKIVINPNTNYAGPQGPSASAYITYSKEEEALRTILSINNMQPPLKIRASLGTTKYCTHYLRNTICPKQDCMYLHDIGDMNASFTKEDMQAGKHQIFEKDLLDNYMLSVQKQRQGNCQNQPTSSDGNDMSEDVSDSAWADVDLDNHLPSNASWAAIRDEKDKKMDTKSRTSSMTSTDYPTIEASNKTSSNPPTSAIDIKGNRTQEESLTKSEKYSPKDSSSHPKGGWMQQTDTIKEKKEDQVEYDTPFQSTPPSRPQQPVPPSVIPQPPVSSTPLLTTTSMSVSSNITSSTNTTTSTTANSYPWPSITDLGLSDLRILPSDDELGFDPFKESKTGLEDLIATEKKQGLSSNETTPKPTFSWDSFWPSNYGNAAPMMMGGTSYSLFGSVQSQPHQQMRPTAPVNPFKVQSPTMKSSSNTNNNNNIQQTTSPLQNPSTSFPFRFSNPQGSTRSTMSPANSFIQQQPPPAPPQQQLPNGIPNHAPPYHPSYGSRFPFMQPAMNPLQQQNQPLAPSVPLSTATTTTTSTTISTSRDASSDKNWQDGLRALFPNINISFACNNWNNENENWNNPEPGVLQQPQHPQTTATVEPKQVVVNPAPLQSSKQPPLQQQNVSSNPPPGFSLLASFESKNKSSWPEKISDEQRQPPPPPGFRSSNDGFNATTSAAVATTTTATASQPTPSAAKNIPQNTNSHNNNKRHSQNLGSHEDPSILWSKVLSDKTSREIETTNMVFPLPGESVDQALSSSNLPATPPQNQQHQHMISWNSVVSGNQYGKSPTTSTTRDVMEPCSVNTAPGKETKEQTRPQKPSPIFGNHQKHAVKKPTAHVKPLKCTPPTDGFMTVNSSTSHRQQINGNAHTGSRVSELDDFSIDLPLAGASNINLTANVVRNFVEYPPVNQTSTATSSKSKKKKKKGKEQGGLISEVIVGLTTTSVVEQSSMEDEKPKNKKNKKKNTKSSPPSQRKNIDGSIEEKRSGDEHNIRVMKTDASTHASVKVTAGNSNGGQVHDQEIVNRLTESTEKLLKNVLFETEAIKLNTEQISKDLKSALEKCKESSLSLSDLEKINLLLTPAKLNSTEADDSDLVDTSDLERQVESARREAKLLEARLNDVIRKNMASELETLKRNTKSPQQQ